MDKKKIAKSSKRKQKFYEKYLKKRINDTKTTYKLYKNLFECITWRSKQNCYSEKLFKYNFKKMASAERANWENDIKVIKLLSKNYS